MCRIYYFRSDNVSYGKSQINFIIKSDYWENRVIFNYVLSFKNDEISLNRSIASKSTLRQKFCQSLLYGALGDRRIKAHVYDAHAVLKA